MKNIQQQTGLNDFFLKLLRPIYRGVFKMTGGPKLADPDEKPDDSEEE